MSEELDKEAKNGTNAELIIKTAVKTFVASICILALLATLGVLFFPYAAMNLYNDLNLKNRALESGIYYLNMNESKYGDENYPPYDSKFVAAIVSVNSLSISLFNDEKEASDKAYYAEFIKQYTEKYLAIPGVFDRSRLIDEFNIAHQPYYAHASLYSYRDCLSRYNYLSRCYLSERDKLFYESKLNDMYNISSLFLNDDLTLTANKIDAFCEIFNQLNAMMDYEFERIGVYELSEISENTLASMWLNPYQNYFEPLTERKADSNLTLLYSAVTKSFPKFTSYVMTMPQSTKEETLKKLYAVRSLGGFASSMDMMLNILSGEHSPYKFVFAVDMMNWRKLNSVNYDGVNMNINDYYNKILLKQYAQFFK